MQNMQIILKLPTVEARDAASKTRTPEWKECATLLLLQRQVKSLYDDDRQKNSLKQTKV